MTHNLLSYRVTPAAHHNDFEFLVKEYCRLGLCFFNTRARRIFGIAPLVVDVYVDRLLHLLRGSNDGDWGILEGFRIWVLVLGVLEAREERRSELVVFLRGLLRRMGIVSHEVLFDRLKGVIWVDELDGVVFWDLKRELWMSGEDC